MDNAFSRGPAVMRAWLSHLFLKDNKSRAKLTWSLRDREDGCRIYFQRR